MFRIFRKRQAQPAVQQPILQSNQLHHLDHTARRAAGNTILTSAASADASATATLALFIRQHQAPDTQLLAKADHLARLQTRPLGWSNTLPVVIRPEPDELAYLRDAHQGPSISPAPIPGTPPWHPEPE